MKREKWIIRKRWSHMYGSPGWYWRVSHSSLPAYFGHSYHMGTFADAVDYATAKAYAGTEPTS
jgi:hypothetical protein